MVAGPFSAPPFDNVVVSPLGIVPKKAPNEFRLMQHLSYPHENSVNSGIPVDFSSVRYASIQDTIVFVKRLGVGCYLAKTDIKSAFRIIPIHPEDYPLLGMKWRGNYYFDRCLPIGCRSSCAIFERFTILHSQQIKGYRPLFNAKSFRKEEGRKPLGVDGFPVHFCSPCPLEFLSHSPS